MTCNRFRFHYGRLHVIQYTAIENDSNFTFVPIFSSWDRHSVAFGDGGNTDHLKEFRSEKKYRKAYDCCPKYRTCRFRNSLAQIKMHKRANSA